MVIMVQGRCFGDQSFGSTLLTTPIFIQRLTFFAKSKRKEIYYTPEIKIISIYDFQAAGHSLSRATNPFLHFSACSFDSSLV